MSYLKQCPYDKATTCRMSHPCKTCDTYRNAPLEVKRDILVKELSELKLIHNRGVEAKQSEINEIRNKILIAKSRG